jgi:hypothetical protein
MERRGWGSVAGYIELRAAKAGEGETGWRMRVGCQVSGVLGRIRDPTVRRVRVPDSATIVRRPFRLGG